MEANAGESFQMQILSNIFPRISLHCKLVPVQYREHEYGLFSTCTNPIIHLVYPHPLPPRPPNKKICIGIGFDFSWDTFMSQEKLQTMKQYGRLYERKQAAAYMRREHPVLLVQNLRSRLSQAAAYPGLGVYTRINSSFRVLCTPRPE